jgi:hypothetical protein
MDCRYRDADDAESFWEFYLRMGNFHEKIKRMARGYAKKNLAVLTHGQFLKLLPIVMRDSPSLSRGLMQDFRLESIRHPSRNTEIILF